MVNTSQSTSQCSPRLPPSPSWHLTLSGLVLDVQFLGFLIIFSSIISFFCVSLGAWCFLLRLATSHPSQLARVRDLPSVSIFNEGYHFAVHVSSTMASLMLSRHRSLFLESVPAGCTRGYASCVHRESSVSPQHALPRAAVSPHNTHLHGAARVGRCLQSSTALVVVLQNHFMSLVFTNTTPTRHRSSCSSHVRSS